jgi:hypothetical protein
MRSLFEVVGGELADAVQLENDGTLLRHHEEEARFSSLFSYSATGNRVVSAPATTTMRVARCSRVAKLERACQARNKPL